jgi:hypothetical protein
MQRPPGENSPSPLVTFVEAHAEFNIAEVSWHSPGAEPMNPADQSSDAYRPSEIADQIDEAALAEVMRVTPLGAAVLAGTAVALLVLGYLAIYLLVFLPRGPVG